MDAVATTDHHDVVFFSYIKEAAAGNLIVFPSMEITLGVPCQALLILDADFPTSLLGQVPIALGLPAPDPAAETHAETQAIAETPSIKNVVAQLERHAFFKGRYIVILNVTENRHKTLLRSGFPDHYKTAPCVAGYLDVRMIGSTDG